VISHARIQSGRLAVWAALIALAAGAALAPPLASARQQTPQKPDQSKPSSADNSGGAPQHDVDLAVVERLNKIRTKKPAEWTAEELAEYVGLIYRGGRQLSKSYNARFDAFREEGRIVLQTGTGEVRGEYTRRQVNGPTIPKDRVRMDLILDTAPRPEDHLRYTITYNGATVWSAQNNQYQQPDPGSAAAFRASIVNDYTALFRYQEEGATLARGGVKKIVGLDTDLVEMTRPDGSKTRFYISPKTFKILHVEYDVVLEAGKPPITFRESYSDWRTIQQTLVPGVRKLRQNNQIVQTVTVESLTFGVSIEDQVFLQI
jgi:hypothetical protein